MAEMTQTNDYAAMFKALGDPTRLHIFEFLQSCCGPVALEEDGSVRSVTGLTVGEICCHLTGAERVTSTISFHLKELRLAGLITVERRGKNMICAMNTEAVAGLKAYFARTSLAAAGSEHVVCGGGQESAPNSREF